VTVRDQQQAFENFFSESKIRRAIDITYLVEVGPPICIKIEENKTEENKIQPVEIKIDEPKS